MIWRRSNTLLLAAIDELTGARLSAERDSMQAVREARGKVMPLT